MPYQSRHSSDTVRAVVAAEISSEASRGDTLEVRLAAMRAVLARARPGSDAEALRILRSAFPESSLTERVAILAGVVGPAR